MKKMIFLKVKNSYNKKLVTWLDLNLQVALLKEDMIDQVKLMLELYEAKGSKWNDPKKVDKN